ncbi:MAG: O-antigen ligase family protein [bacterium]|nr:O-antigen ligase family protein [bacterium]
MASKKRNRTQSLSEASHRAIRNPASESLPDRDALAWLQPISGFLLGTLCVWSFLVPADATSVYQGQALPQNLFWLLAACITAAAAVRQTGFRFSRSAWTFSLLSLAALILVSLRATDGNNPRVVWNGCWQLIALGACWFSARYTLCGPSSRAMLVSLCLTGCLASSLYGLYQVQVELPASREQYLKDPDATLANAGVFAPPGSPQRIRFENRLLQSNEPYANFALANSLASVLSAALLIVAASLAHSLYFHADPGGARPWHRPGYWALLAALAILVLCWFLTRSRTAYAAVFATLLIGTAVAWARSRFRAGQARALMVGAAVVCLLSLVGGVWLLQNDALVFSEARKSLGYRLEYWQATLSMIADHWLTGVGLGNFQSYYPYYKLATASEEIADPHNWILDLTATLGLVLGLGIAALIGWTTLSIFLRQPDDAATYEPGESGQVADQQSSRSILVGGLVGGGMCGILLWLLAAANLAVWLATWLVAGLLAAVCCRPIRQCITEQGFLMGLGPLALLICLLASGSWQASGIAVPFLILLAAGLPDAIRSAYPRPDKQNPQTAFRWQPEHGALLLACSGLAVFLYQTWLPTTHAWSLLQQAQSASRVSDQLALARAAAAADPLDTQAEAFAAQGQVSLAVSADREQFNLAASQAIEQLDGWLNRDRNNFTNWRLAGNLMLDLCAVARQHGMAEDIFAKKAMEYHAQAVQLYPTSVELQIQAAASASLAKQWNAALENIETAILLSSLTPHEDKKLGRDQTMGQGVGDQVIWWPFPTLPSELRGGPPNMVLAEPLIEWIRTQAEMQ